MSRRDERSADHLHLGRVGERRPAEVYGAHPAQRNAKRRDRGGDPTQDAADEHVVGATADVSEAAPRQLRAEGVRLLPVPLRALPHQPVQGEGRGRGRSLYPIRCV